MAESTPIQIPAEAEFLIPKGRNLYQQDHPGASTKLFKMPLHCCNKFEKFKMGISICCILLFVSTLTLVTLLSLIVNGSANEDARPKLLIDSDGGVDDAMAIFMVLSRNHREINLLSVTTVQGNTDVENATMNILTTLNIAGKLNEIPVYMGSSTQLVKSEFIADQFYYGRDGFGDTDIEKTPLSRISGNLAAVNIVETVLKYPGEVSLMCIGPLTNIAIAMKLYPDLISNIKDMYILGGSVEGRGNLGGWKEFNFAVDPDAANVVFAYATKCKSKCKIYLLPWEPAAKIDTTWKWWNENVEAKIHNKKIELLKKGSQFHKGNDTEHWIESDSLLAAIYLDYNYLIVDSQEIGISVTTCPEEHAGSTILNTKSNAVIALTNINTSAYEHSVLNYLQ